MGEDKGRQGSDKGKEGSQEQGGGGKGRQKPSAVEWILGGVSAVLVVAMIGFVLYRAVSATMAKPDLEVLVGQIEAVDGGYRVEFRAINRSDATAAGVKVEGQLRSGDRTIETSEVTLDYVPARSEKKGGLLFNHEPGQLQLQIEAKGYTNP